MCSQQSRCDKYPTRHAGQSLKVGIQSDRMRQNTQGSAHPTVQIVILLILFIFIGCITGPFTMSVLAQENDQRGMEVAERDEAGQAIRFNFDFPSGNLQSLIKFISAETNLTIIASESDIKDKKFALTNLKNVTIDETLEEIKTVLAQYDLTMIRTNNTLLITTFGKAVRMKVPVKRIVADPNLIEHRPRRIRHSKGSSSKQVDLCPFFPFGADCPHAVTVFGIGVQAGVSKRRFGD